MTKVYKSLSETLPDLVLLATHDPNVTFLLANELLKDSNGLGVVPRQDGFLANSAVIHSMLDEGLIIYNTPYARRRYYEGSNTGQLMWVEATAKKNYQKYKKMLNKAMDQKKEEMLK